MTIFVIYKCWSDQMIPIFDSRVRSVCGVSSAQNKATYLTWNDKDLFHLNVILRDGVGGKISMGPFNCLVMMGRMYLVFVWCLSTNNFGLLFFFYVVFLARIWTLNCLASEAQPHQRRSKNQDPQGC